MKYFFSVALYFLLLSVWSASVIATASASSDEPTGCSRNQQKAFEVRAAQGASPGEGRSLEAFHGPSSALEMKDKKDFPVDPLLLVEIDGREDVFEWEASLDAGLKLVGEEFLDLVG
jgi:hypothetical protein